jgi:hypothetical protein
MLLTSSQATIVAALIGATAPLLSVAIQTLKEKTVLFGFDDFIRFV